MDSTEPESSHSRTRLVFQRYAPHQPNYRRVEIVDTPNGARVRISVNLSSRIFRPSLVLLRELSGSLAAVSNEDIEAGRVRVGRDGSEALRALLSDAKGTRNI